MENLVPGAVPFPGVFANYGAGRIRAWLAVIWHYTVGTNSLVLIANNGLCAFLIARDGTIYQCSPWDSVNYTQCEWNVIAQGIEVESLDGSITDAQVASLGYLTIFLANVGAVPLNFYNGARLPFTAGYTGVTNHRCLDQHACANHFDGFDEDVWNAAIHPAPPTPPAEPPKEGEMRLFRNTNTNTWYLWDGYNWNPGIPEDVVADLAFNGGIPGSAVSDATMTWLMVHVGQNVEAQIQRIAKAVKG